MKVVRRGSKLVEIELSEEEKVKKTLPQILKDFDERLKRIEEILGIKSKSKLEEVVRDGYNP